MLEKFLDAPWFEKLFWLFFAAVAAFILYTFLHIVYETLRAEWPRPKKRARGRSAGGGAGLVATDVGASLVSVPSADASFEASSDSGSSESSGGGGGEFSGGGGESGGGGASGGW